MTNKQDKDPQKNERSNFSDDAMSRKVLELSRRKHLKPPEATFITDLANLGSRTATYVLERQGTVFPTGDRFADAVKEYTRSATRVFENKGTLDDATRELLAGAADDRDKLTAVMHRYTNVAPSAHNDALRGRVEDCAMAADVILSEVMAQNPAVQVDAYMAGNLNTIAAHYEAIAA